MNVFSSLAGGDNGSVAASVTGESSHSEGGQKRIRYLAWPVWIQSRPTPRCAAVTGDQMRRFGPSRVRCGSLPTATAAELLRAST